MWNDQAATSQGRTIEQFDSGLLHQARLESDGRLTVRTTVLPDAGPEAWRTKIGGTVGETRMVAWLLEQLAKGNGETAVEPRAAELAERALAWADQFPDQVEDRLGAYRPLAVNTNGQILVRNNELVGQRSIGTGGWISNFRNAGPRTPSTFHAWRRAGSGFVGTPLLTRDGYLGPDDALQRIAYEDGWWDALVMWWLRAWKAGGLTARHDAVWTLPASAKTPDRPLRIA